MLSLIFRELPSFCERDEAYHDDDYSLALFFYHTLFPSSTIHLRTYSHIQKKKCLYYITERLDPSFQLFPSQKLKSFPLHVDEAHGVFSFNSMNRLVFLGCSWEYQYRRECYWAVRSGPDCQVEGRSWIVTDALPE